MRGLVDEHHKKIAVLLRDYARAMIKTMMSANAPPWSRMRRERKWQSTRK